MMEEYEIRPIFFYTDKHAWIRLLDDDTVKVGITDYAQKKLKEIVYVELPEVGREVSQMEQIGSIESVKAVSELLAPVSGKIREVNEKLIDNPSLINKDPYETGWLIIIEPIKQREELKKLLSASDYRKLISTCKIS